MTRVSAFRQILMLTSLPRKHSLALCLQKGTLIYASVELVKQLLPLLHIHNDWQTKIFWGRKIYRFSGK